MRIAILLSVMCSVAAADFASVPNMQRRTWTSTAGTTCEATLVSVDTQAEVVRLRAKGKTLEVPMAKLSKADLEWLAPRLNVDMTAPRESLADYTTKMSRWQRIARSQRGDMLRNQAKARSMSRIRAGQTSVNRTLAQGHTATLRGSNQGVLRRTTVYRGQWTDTPTGSVYRSKIGPEYLRYAR